jgi:hypothetical protein
MVSNGSSRIVVSFMGKLYPARSRRLEQELEGMLLGEQGGESSDWGCSKPSDFGIGSSRMVENGDEKFRVVVLSDVRCMR